MRVLVLLLYAPVCLAVMRWFIPRMSPSGRLLAIAMLAAQIVILAVGLEDTPRWILKGWLWHLDQEWNIPSSFASMQSALVGGAALTTAILARAYTKPHRLYMCALGFFFLLLAWDEYFTLHETDLALETAYIAFGALIAAATLMLAARSPRKARAWHIGLLAGMALNVAGAMAVDALPQTCKRLGSLLLDGCLRFYNLEEAFEFIGVWLILVAVLVSLSQAAPRLRRVAAGFLFVFPLVWLLLLTHDAWLPRYELRFRAKPTSIVFESGLRLQGYQLEWDSDSVVIWLYPSAWRSHYQALGFSAHLVDQVSGASVASRNAHAKPQFRLLLAPSYEHLYRQRITVEIPPETPRNRAYWITLSVWRDSGDDFASRKILESDHQLLSETHAILGELALPAATSRSFEPLAEFGEAYTLGAVDLPGSAKAGAAVALSFVWRANAAGVEDLVQYLHLGHVESGEWQVYDRQPLGPRLPTRLWYSGMVESETWEVALPAELAPGEYRALTGLYRLDDGERIPASDMNGEPFADARVPLGSLIIKGA